MGNQVFLNVDRWWFATPTWNGYLLDDYRAYIARLRNVPGYFARQIVNLRAGLARGFSVGFSTSSGSS